MFQLQAQHLVPLIIVCEEDHDLPSGLLKFFPIHQLADEARRLFKLGLTSCKLYVKTRTELKDAHASVGLQPDSLMVRAIQEIKNAVPEMQVGTEVCACAYHSDGECVLTNHHGHGVDDAATHDLVANMSVLHANAGADTIVAGLTHDGSITAIRQALDQSSHTQVQVMGSVQLRTGFYGPYRSMMGTEPEAGETFRSHVIATDRQAIIDKAHQLISEGAASLSIQPALLAATVLAELKQQIAQPIAAYSVSTELNLVRGNGPDLWMAAGQEFIFEEYFSTLIQAGAKQVQTYIAGDLAAWLEGRE